jgi:hypothetical protein
MQRSIHPVSGNEKLREFYANCDMANGLFYTGRRFGGEGVPVRRRRTGSCVRPHRPWFPGTTAEAVDG